jgi:hypothetical protein
MELVHCEKVAGVVNCDYSEKSGPVEQNLILFMIRRISQTSFLKHYPHTCLRII